MGTNFHTAWIDGTTEYKASDMNSPLSTLDRGITYLKNVIVHTDGEITYNKSTGQIAWSDELHIHFNDASGNAKHNSVAAGNVTLTDGQFAYVDLNETDDTVLTVSAATITTGSASNFLAYNRLVLAYRNTDSDELFLVALKSKFDDRDKIVQTVSYSATPTINWALGSTAVITLTGNITSFTFTGGRNGQKCTLILVQDGTGGRTITSLGTDVLCGDDLTDPPTLSTAGGDEDILGFIYRSSDSKYRFVAFATGF